MSDLSPTVDAESGENSTETTQEASNENALTSPAPEVPRKAKRGRPRKNVAEKPRDDGVPVIKRPRGRPKGSKNKNPKPKPIVTGPKRPRGRPRKWPPPDTSMPKRSRGRPRKNLNASLELPTMVGSAEIGGVTPLSTNATSTVTAPIALPDAVPPDNLFNNDEGE